MRKEFENTWLDLQNENIENKHYINILKQKYLGSDSLLIKTRKGIKNYSIEEKKILAPLINDYVEKFQNYLSLAEKKFTQKEKVDIELPVYYTIGKRSLLSMEIDKLFSICFQMNYEYVEGPIIDTEFNNFDALGIEPKHPSRSLHDTFFLKSGKILRTHTSNTQRLMLNKKQCFTIGQVFRNDHDATHLPMFHQIEFVCINENANLENLFKTIRQFLALYFENNYEIRIRHSYFPFTSQSYEIDIFFNNNWLEILGCGIISPVVFEKQNIEHKLGFALGCGVERIIMIKNNITDIRSLYGI